MYEACSYDRTGETAQSQTIQHNIWDAVNGTCAYDIPSLHDTTRSTPGIFSSMTHSAR